MTTNPADGRQTAHQALLKSIRNAAASGVLTPVTVRSLVAQGAEVGVSELVIRELIESQRLLADSGSMAVSLRRSPITLDGLANKASAARRDNALTQALRECLVQEGISAGFSAEEVLDAIRGHGVDQRGWSEEEILPTLDGEEVWTLTASFQRPPEQPTVDEDWEPPSLAPVSSLHCSPAKTTNHWITSDAAYTIVATLLGVSSIVLVILTFLNP